MFAFYMLFIYLRNPDKEIFPLSEKRRDVMLLCYFLLAILIIILRIVYLEELNELIPYLLILGLVVLVILKIKNIFTKV